jgi:hypothetical protein
MKKNTPCGRQTLIFDFPFVNTFIFLVTLGRCIECYFVVLAVITTYDISL